MILAAYRDTGYKVVLFLHIVAVLVSVAPAVVHPILFEFEKRRDDGDVVGLASRMSAASRIYAIAVIVAGIIGFGLISMSDDAISWGDTWVWLSIVIWLALNGLLHASMLPAEKALAGGDRSALGKIDTIGPVLGIMMLALVFLMTIKPGGGF
jgi:uncharacterized membrane protein